MKGHPGERALADAPGWREVALALFGFAALTICLTYPLAFQLGTHARIDNGDGRFAIWNVAWVARTLVVDPVRVFDANIFYPHGGTLAYSEANLAAGLLAIPIYWTTRNPYAAYNFVLLLSFVLSGAGMYFLVRYLVRDRRAAVIAAICFAYCPYVFGHLPHVQLLLIAGFPLGLLAFHRLVDRPTVGRGATLGLVVAAQAYACGYYVIFLVLALGLAIVVTTAHRHLWRETRYWTALIVGIGVALTLAAPLLVTYLTFQRETGFSRPLDAAQLFAADWRAYLASSAYPQRWMLRVIGHWNEVLFPGFVAVGFGTAGVIAGWNGGGRLRELTIVYAGIAGLGLWASFGPDAGLYRILYDVVPGFTFLRTSSRFGVLVVFALSVFAGIAVAVLLGKLAKPTLVASLITCLGLAEAFRPLRFPQVPAVEPAYRLLATLPRGAVLELPVYSRRAAHMRTRYMLNSTVHWMPVVDAYSDYIPPDFQHSEHVLGQFPTAASLQWLRTCGVRYAVFHVDQYRDHQREALLLRLQEFSMCLRELYADDRTLMFEIATFCD